MIDIGRAETLEDQKHTFRAGFDRQVRGWGDRAQGETEGPVHLGAVVEIGFVDDGSGRIDFGDFGQPRMRPVDQRIAVGQTLDTAHRAR